MFRMGVADVVREGSNVVNCGWCLGDLEWVSGIGEAELGSNRRGGSRYHALARAAARVSRVSFPSSVSEGASALRWSDTFPEVDRPCEAIRIRGKSTCRRVAIGKGKQRGQARNDMSNAPWISREVQSDRPA